jgi:hypothetical protein
MSEKKLPIALIGAFFVIGVLLGLQFIGSDAYRQLSEDVQAYFKQSATPSPEDKQATVTERAERVVTGASPATNKTKGGFVSDATTETFLCDTASAEKIRNKARSIAEISETADGVLHVRLRQEWAYYTPGIRKSFLQTFAESDACILGHSRTIHFYYNGEEIAISRPAKGLKVE